MLAKMENEEDLRTINARLTAELKLAQIRGNELAEELESLCYSISHDLKAPLRAIESFSQLLQEDSNQEFSQEVREQIGTIERSAAHMAELIDELLSLSRYISKHPVLSHVNMNNLVRSIFEMKMSELPDRVVVLNLSDLPEVLCDQDMIAIVIGHLIANAIRFTKKRAIGRIDVAATEDDSLTTFFVKDNGEGFDMRYAARLFKVFQKLHGAEFSSGNGVGLALVKRLVRQHGGAVWAEGQPGEGACFYFTLPKGIANEVQRA